MILRAPQPSSQRYVSRKAGAGTTKAWCSLWNYSSVAELNLETGKVEIWHDLLGSPDSIAPGSHPTAMLLSPNEDNLYVALSNSDVVVSIDLKTRKPIRRYRANLDEHGQGGSVPQAIALSHDGKRLYAAAASLDAVAVFDTDSESSEIDVRPRGFIPTEWYPSALAISGNDLLIASAKGQGSGPNNMIGTLKSERRHREHPYIPTLIGGSIARLSLDEIEKNLSAYTKQVEEDNLLRADPGKFAFPDGKNPIRHVIYILKENRTYDQVLGDLPVGNGDPSLTLYGAEVTPNQHKLALQFGVSRLANVGEAG